MADAFATYKPSLESPARFAAAVTPDDAADLANVARALWVDAEGDVVVYPAGDTAGTAITFTGVAAGTILPIRVRRVLEATTATVIALW